MFTITAGVYIRPTHLDLKFMSVHRWYGAKCDYCLLAIKCRDITMMRIGRKNKHSKKKKKKKKEAETVSANPVQPKTRSALY